ncbi:MAG: phage N-6-adenine-methyltransferase [Plesiomonas shigelloides]
MKADYTGSNTPESIRDLWQTPKQVFNALNGEFNFACDVAASDKNKLCAQWITEEHNALQVDWSEIEDVKWGYVWCNPPYSKIMPWVQKAIEQQKQGVGTVMLVPADMSVGWFNEARMHCQEVRVIVGGRLAFVNADTQKPVGGNNKGSMLIIFRPHGFEECRVTFVERDNLMGC